MSTILSYAPLEHIKLGLWSLRQKIIFKTGYNPIKIWQNSNSFNMEFVEDLTEQEIGTIDDIVNNPNAQGPDVDLQIINNSYIMRDIYVYRELIAAESGIDFSVWFQPSGTFGPQVMDEIVIIPTDQTHTMQRILTNPQKNALVNAIISGNRWQ